MSLVNLFKTAEDHDLTSADIMKITNNKCKIISYHELVSVNSIDDLLTNNGACIVLYETRQNFGHWTALIRQSPNTLEFFDSYGFQLDQELNYAKYDNTPFLSNLVKKSNYNNIIQNKHRLQQFAKDVNTCGRWTSLRIVMKNLSIDDFVRLFTTNNSYNADFWATSLTYLFVFQ